MLYIQALLAATTYFLRSERNQRIFQRKSMHAEPVGRSFVDSLRTRPFVDSLRTRLSNWSFWLYSVGVDLCIYIVRGLTLIPSVVCLYPR